MKHLSAQYQMYVAIALVAVVAIAAIFLGILPLFQQAADLNAEIETEKANLASAQALVARRQSAKAQSAANEVELMRIANQVPDSPQLPSVIIEIQDLANAAGVELMQLQVGDVEPAPPLQDGTVPAYSRLQITVTFDGSWVEVIDFTRRVNKLDRGIRGVAASYAYNPPDVDNGIPAFVRGTAIIEVYMMAPAATTTVPATTVPTTNQ